MNLTTFLAITAVVGILYGVAFLLVPEILLSLYGVATVPAAVLECRFFGSALIAWGLIAWLAKDSRDWVALRGVLAGSAVGQVAGLVVAIWGTVTSLMSAMGWSAVLIYLLLLVGSVYFLSTGARAQAAG